MDNDMGKLIGQRNGDTDGTTEMEIHWTTGREADGTTRGGLELVKQCSAYSPESGRAQLLLVKMSHKSWHLTMTKGTVSAQAPCTTMLPSHLAMTADSTHISFLSSISNLFSVPLSTWIGAATKKSPAGTWRIVFHGHLKACDICAVNKDLAAGP